MCVFFKTLVSFIQNREFTCVPFQLNILSTEPWFMSGILSVEPLHVCGLVNVVKFEPE